MNLGLAHILHPVIISSLSFHPQFLLAVLLLCLPFCSCCFPMRWMNGLTSHCTEDILALLGIGRGLCSFPCVLHVDIQILHLAELKLCLLFQGSRMCIFPLLFDCSAETYYQLVVDTAASNSVSPTPYNKVCVTWVELGGLCPHLHIWLLRTTHWKRCVHNSLKLNVTEWNSPQLCSLFGDLVLPASGVSVTVYRCPGCQCMSGQQSSERK